MRKIGMYILACLLVFGVITPAQAETASTWDVKGTGTNPYTLTFTGEGVVNLESETELVFADGLTGQAIDMTKTPTVTFTAETAPIVKIISEDQTKTVLIEFGREVKEEPAPEEPVTEEPPAEEPVKEDPPAEEPVKEEPVKEEPKPETEQPVATTGTINGIIWYDENEDGIRQEKETRINDVPVYLLNKEYDVVEEVYTKDGLYSFNDLKPGTYYVEVYGMDIGYYYTSPKHQGTDPTIDSDLDDEDLARVKLKAGDIVQIDAGLYGQDEEEMDFANLLIVTNFLDANADKSPGYSEQTIPATYTVTDAITGKDVYTEKIGKDDALMIEMTPGTYTIKTEVAAGYTVEAMHHVSLDDLAISFKLTKAEAKALAVGMADEDEEEFPEYDEFLKLFKRKAATDSVTLTDETMGYVLLAEIAKVKPVAVPKPTPTKSSVKTVEAPETSVADQKTTNTTSNERLPQAGEDKPFPYAATGAGLAVVGLWLLLRRAG
ncbi:SdrD B-like domain-containing protein [Exiguobacterium antarcticum]|uniref:SdrD B-like domain-containing protein n=1 Tax=Exiguobacterium antarcticum TaxID=132920 RepID=UPI000285EAEF|nr:SdrD B-like domain-containing protein [Exiguobacterium antarcticum]AFS71552.1 LPXTG-motif cell wall anchor domain protein [Exiguobacterium antarcticum B7]